MSRHAQRFTLRALFALVILSWSGLVSCAPAGEEEPGKDASGAIDTPSPSDAIDATTDVVAPDSAPADTGEDALPPEDAGLPDTPPPVDAQTDSAPADIGLADAVEDSSVPDAALEDKPKGPVQKLCESSGGEWDEGSCGHWVCGEPPACQALIPGCNCGPDKVFDGGVGCIESVDCGKPGPEETCQSTGGTWLPGTCGDWYCGQEPACDAIIPGCNCGPGKVFNEDKGCMFEPDCAVVGNAETLCMNTGGEWLPETCGHWNCGEPPLCKAIIPGCNCGKDKNFDVNKGCFVDPSCKALPNPDQENTCNNTGGTWILATCGSWKCGLEPICAAILPGCNCGLDKSFDKLKGCYDDPSCPGNNANSPKGLCDASGGQWHPTSCTSWKCGVEPAPCVNPMGGCDCGMGKNLIKEYGCLDSPIFCTGGDNEAMCTGTGGTYHEDSCGNYMCGVKPLCPQAKPGCDCGAENLFFPQYGCLESVQCEP